MGQAPCPEKLLPIQLIALLLLVATGLRESTNLLLKAKTSRTPCISQPE